MSVFIDSGAFVAALFRGDHHHARMRGLFARPPRKCLSSVLVVSETYSWFLHKRDEEAARSFLDFVNEIDGLEIVETSASATRDTKRMLDRFRGSKLTYVDAFSLVVIDRHRVKDVWGTDRDLTFTGARLVE